MNPQAWLFLLRLSLISDIVVSFLGLLSLLSFRNGPAAMRYARVQAALLAGVFLQGIFWFVANTFPRSIQASPGYATWYWIGRGCACVGVWVYVLWLVRYRKGGA